MIEDFLRSKIFPKFYLKTDRHEIFAIGKSKETTKTLVGFIPTGKIYDHFFEKGLYTPKWFEISPSINPILNLPSFDSEPYHSFHDLTKKEWIQRVNITKNAIKQGLIQKAILKRTSKFRFRSPISIERFFNTYRSCTFKLNHFFIQQDESSAFMGATPELLFQRTDNTIKTIALAATISSHLDHRFLLQDQKMMKEFQFVKEHILSLLEEFCENIKVGITKPKTFYHLTHLYAEIEAKIKQIDDDKIIQILHPTAAIIGLPRKSAIHFLETVEETPRNLYACALGYSTEEQGEFYVGIRSLFIEQNLLHAFCGVGIVEESDPLKEWEELNLKLKTVKIWMGK